MDYYATILLHLESDPRADACWKLAVTLARRFGSRVAGLSCQRSTRFAAGPAAMLEASARPHEDTDGLPELEARFLRYCTEHGCSAREFIVSDGEPAASIVRRAAEADLVVMRQPAAEGPPTARHRKLVDDVLLENPRPTLLVPRHGDFALTGDCVVVAWDGSRGAARAATDALPFLRQARVVHLVQFSDALLDDEGEAEDSVRRAAAWLASHGVPAKGQARRATIPVGEALLSAAADVGADLLVMGGTTTATVLAHAMIREGLKHVAAGLNPMELKRGLERAVESVVATLAADAQPCGGAEQVAHVAALSANNDRAIGELVARAFEQVGREGAISIEDGSGIANELEVAEGLKFDRGYISAYFVNEAERQQVVLEDALVLVCDHRLAAAAAIVPLMEAAAREGKPLLVIAEDVAEDVLATLVVNHLRGIVKGCAVKAPGFGDARKAALADIALVTGATLVSDQLGLALDKVALEHLGRARRVTVDKDTTIVAGSAGDIGAIATRVAALRKDREAAKDDFSRRQLDDRIARLSGGVGVIKVGASTELELKEKKLRVEDALHATRAAIAEGIVAGGGVALLRARRSLRSTPGTSLEDRAACAIVRRALEEPLRRIVANAAEEPSTVLDHVDSATEPAFGYNAATGEYGNLLAMGVIDPAKVTRLALQNAASVAGLVLTTDCVVAALPGNPPPAALPAF